MKKKSDQNLTVFSIIYMIRIRFFVPGELIPKGVRAAQYWSHAGDEAEEAHWEDEVDAEDDGDDTQDDTTCLCHSCSPDAEFSDVVDRMEHDMVRACSRLFLERRRRVRGGLGLCSRWSAPRSSDGNTQEITE